MILSSSIRSATDSAVSIIGFGITTRIKPTWDYENISCNTCLKLILGHFYIAECNLPISRPIRRTVIFFVRNFRKKCVLWAGKYGILYFVFSYDEVRLSRDLRPLLGSLTITQMIDRRIEKMAE